MVGLGLMSAGVILCLNGTFTVGLFLFILGGLQFLVGFTILRRHRRRPNLDSRPPVTEVSVPPTTEVSVPPATEVSVPPAAETSVEPFLVEESRFDVVVDQWERANGPMAQLIHPQPPTLKTDINPDFTQYSFDRVIVCDNDAIAQFLIANNFHFERNCPVLSINGYPQGIFSTILGMLQRNPELMVYALHNADAAGIALKYKLRSDPAWFGNTTARVYTLGLAPWRVLADPKVVVLQSLVKANDLNHIPETVRQALTSSEVEWLKAGNYVELDSYSPQTLLQTVVQGVVASPRHEVIKPIIGNQNAEAYPRQQTSQSSHDWDTDEETTTSTSTFGHGGLFDLDNFG